MVLLLVIYVILSGLLHLLPMVLKFLKVFFQLDSYHEVILTYTVLYKCMNTSNLYNFKMCASYLNVNVLFISLNILFILFVAAVLCLEVFMSFPIIITRSFSSVAACNILLFIV